MKRRRDHAHVDVDTLPSTEAFNSEVRTAWFVMLSLPRLYKMATDAATWPPGGGIGVPITGGSVSNPTRETATDPALERQRDAIRTAVEWMRKSAEAADKARSALLGNQVEQPQHVHPKATITQAELSDRIDRRRPRIRVWRAGDEEKVR